MGLEVAGPSGPLSDTSVPTWIDVAVTPTSDAVLAAAAGVADTGRAVVAGVAPAPGFDAVVVVAPPPPEALGTDVDLAPPTVVEGPPPTTAAPSPRACSNAELGRLLPQPPM